MASKDPVLVVVELKGGNDFHEHNYPLYQRHIPRLQAHCWASRG